MRTRKPVAICVAVATVWSLLSIALVIGVLSVGRQIAEQAHQTGRGADFMLYMSILFVPTFFMWWGALAFYVIHASQNAALDNQARILWAVALFLTFPLAAAIYWWLHAWPRTYSSQSV